MMQDYVVNHVVYRNQWYSSAKNKKKTFLSDNISVTHPQMYMSMDCALFPIDSKYTRVTL